MQAVAAEFSGYGAGSNGWCGYRPSPSSAWGASHGPEACWRLGLTGLLLHLSGEPKSGTFARFAAETDFTLHEGHQLHGDGKAQAGAAVLAGRGTIGLAKGLKEVPLDLERNADSAVLNLEANLCVCRGFTPLWKSERPPPLCS